MSAEINLMRGKWRRAAIFCLCLGLLGAATAVWGRNPAVEVRRLGLSRVGEHTMLTVILSGVATPRISTRTQGGIPQLVLEFPQAQAGRLPTRLAGDDLLVAQVRTKSAPGGGVKIVMDLFPETPYKFWRQSRSAPGGQTFILGLTPDPAAMQARRAPTIAAPPPPEAPVTRAAPQAMPENEPEPPPPAPEDYGVKEERGAAAAGSFGGLQRLIPKARALLEGLEREGWAVSDSHTYDRPGQRFSRDFVLTNRLYPELAIKIANLPANAPNVPHINIIMLTTDNLRGETAEKYRNLRQWSFAKIKQNFEDIGDFFDDALKPLRIKLRKETKAVTLKDSKVFQNFLQRACPQQPQLSQKFMEHVNEKVNQRFEGVQYTLSENPLVILNMVDFLYLKVFFLETN